MPSRDLAAADAANGAVTGPRPFALFASHRAASNIARTAVSAFERDFEVLFNTELPRLQRVVVRLSGDSALAADVVQEAFIRLHRRGSLPDTPRQWMITVVLNLYRNAAAKDSRRSRLLSVADRDSLQCNRAPSAQQTLESSESQRRVRAALDRMAPRDARLLMLLAEEYSYREMAGALQLNESSIGTLLVRAKAAFRASYGESDDAR